MRRASKLGREGKVVEIDKKTLLGHLDLSHTLRVKQKNVQLKCHIT